MTEKTYKIINQLDTEFKRVYGQYFHGKRLISVIVHNDKRFTQCPYWEWIEETKGDIIAYTENIKDLLSYPFMEEYSHIPLTYDVERAGEAWFYHDFLKKKKLFVPILDGRPEIAIRLALMKYLVEEKHPLAVVRLDIFFDYLTNSLSKSLFRNEKDDKKDGAFFIFVKKDDFARDLFFDISVEKIRHYIRFGEIVPRPTNALFVCHFGGGKFIEKRNRIFFEYENAVYMYNQESIMDIIAEGIKKYVDFERNKQETEAKDEWVLER